MMRHDEESADPFSHHRAARQLIGSLAGINRQCLELLARQAAGSSRTFALAEVVRQWQQLDESSRWRAADYPFLLFDAGFADSRRWEQLDESTVHEPSLAYGAFFTVPEAVPVARAVFVLASSMALLDRTGARLALGMHPRCISTLAARPIADAPRMADRCWTWLRPRWAHKPQIWRELLTAGADGAEAHQLARLHGMRLIEADAAAAAAARLERP